MVTRVIHERLVDDLAAADTTTYGATASIAFYTGVPGNDDTAIPAGTELVVIDLAATPWAAPGAPSGSAGSRTVSKQLAAVTAVTPSTAGTAGSYCIFNSQSTRDATTMLEKGDVTVTGGGGAITFGSVTFTTSDPVDLDEANFTKTYSLNLTA